MRMLATLATIAIVGYVALGLLLFLLQEKMVFLPNLPGRQLDATPRYLGLDYDDVSFAAEDGMRLHGWYVPADDSKGTVLFLHGNAGNISHRLDSIAIFNDLGLNTFIIDYRGYGQSEGKPGERGMYLDARGAWSYLVDERGEDPRRIVIFGRSIGGAFAARLAASQPASGVIVESSFTSATDMASKLYPFMPVRLISRLELPVVDDLARSLSPVLVVHSRDDEIIPFAMGRALYDAAPEPKQFLELAGDHNGGFLFDPNYYRAGLSAFLDAHLPSRNSVEKQL